MIFLKQRKQIYIEPAIRTVVGAVLLIVISIEYLTHPHFHPILFFVGFIGLNFFQSGFSGFCGMEKILKAFKFKSEKEEIKSLGEQIGRAKADQEYLKTLNLLEEAIVEIDSENKIIRVSDSFSNVLQCDCSSSPSCTACTCNDSCLGNSFFKYLLEGEVNELQEKFEALRKEKNLPLNTHFKIKDFHGKEKVIEGKFLYTTGEGSSEAKGCIKGILHDLTDTIHHEKRILHLTLHDSLTGLPNRILFTDRLEQTINFSRRNDRVFALMFIDVDSFKSFNETYGHRFSDDFLVELAGALKRNMREMDSLSRWGSDEFVVLLTDFKDPSEIKKIAVSFFQRVTAELQRQFSSIEVSLSSGIVIYPDDGQSSEQLFLQANRALEKAKSKDTNSFVFYSDVFKESFENFDGDITTKLKHGILNDKIQVHYQPIINAKTGEIVSYEAFARWLDDDYGWVNPKLFIQMTENLGLIHQFGK
ncbi:MAG: diguanylate cyclase, partial [Spirochaetia bacterium]|nr:diguanylate cyclase [Spirochaetia bacterium]